MRAYFKITDNEQTILMDLVCIEQVKRYQSIDDYNVQELAFRQAVSDGAMRTDNYFNN